jgi:hypothetical protein
LGGYGIVTLAKILEGAYSHSVGDDFITDASNLEVNREYLKIHSGANRREYAESYLNARSEAIARGILERKARVAV